MRIQFTALSDVGLVREKNEDSYLVEPGLGIYAVADGMGGHASGEIASRLAAETLRDFLSRAQENSDATHRIDASPDSAGPANLLAQGVRLANHKIYQASRERSEYQGMGTTLVAVYFSSGAGFLANVGDSRLYRIRGSAIEQLSEDHSLVWEYFRKGLISKDALCSSPYKNIVTRALGVHPTVEVDVRELSLEVKDLLLLCSDGLTDMVKEDEMLQTVGDSAAHLEEAARRLVHLAISRGGKDNITVVLIQVESL